MTVDGRIKTWWFLYFSPANGALSDAQIATLARYDRGWIQALTEIIAPGPPYEPPQDYAPITAITNAIKAVNPDTRIGIYEGSGFFARPYEPIYPSLNSADLFNKPDGTDLIYEVNDVKHKFPNYLLGEVRSRVIAFLLALCEEEDFDGLFLDSWSPAAMAQWIALPPPSGFLELPGGILEGPAHTSAFWEAIFTTFTRELTAAFEATGRFVHVNGLGFDSSSAYLGALQVNTADYATGTHFESVYEAYRDPTKFAQAISAVRTATLTKGAECFVLALPTTFNITAGDGAGGSTVPYILNRDLMRFYLALYLLVDLDGRTFLGYFDQGAGEMTTPFISAFGPSYTPWGGPYFGWDVNNDPAVYYADDWDHEYGRPTGHYVDGGTTRLWWRKFTRGYAVVNPTAGALTFREPGAFRVWHPTAGQVVNIGPEASSWYACPPYSGHFLFNRLQEAA